MATRRRASTDSPAHLLEPLEQRRLLATVSWDGGAGTNSWHDAANWSGDQLPGAADHVLINVAGSAFLIRHSQSIATSVASISSLEPLVLSGGSIATTGDWAQNAAMTISGGSIGGSGRLFLQGPVTWSGGSMTGTGRTIVEAGRTLTIKGSVTLARYLFVDGTLNWQAGGVGFDNGVLVVRPAGVMVAQGAGTAAVVNGTGALGVNGRFVRAGTGSSEAVATVDVPLYGLGTVEIQAARLRVRGGFTSELLMTGGGLIIGETLTVTAFMSWTGGEILEAGSIAQAPVGRLRIGPQAAASITGTAIKSIRGTILENVGVVNLAEGGLSLRGAVVENWGQFNAFVTNISADINPLTRFDNRGTFVKHGAWALFLNDRLELNNFAGGRIEVENGSIVALRGVNSGTITGAPGTELRLGRFTMAGGLIEGFETVLTTVDETVTWTAGSIGAGGMFYIQEDAALELAAGGARTLARDVTNRGLVAWSGGTLSLESAAVLNMPTGVVNLWATGTLTGSASTITNLGTLNKLGPGALFLAATGITLDNQGRVGALGGSLTLVASSVVQVSGSSLTGGRWSVLNGASLHLAGAQILTNHATINIAGSGASFAAVNGLRVNNGTFTLADATFTIQPGAGAFVNNGRLSVFSGAELNVQGGLTFGSASRFLIGITSPNDHGRVLTTGTIATGGQVEALFTLFIPTPTDSFAILTTAGSTVTGVFASTVTTGLPNGLSVSPAYLPSAVRLLVN